MNVTIRTLATGAVADEFVFPDGLEGDSYIYPSQSNTLYAGLVNGPDVFGPSNLLIVTRDGTPQSQVVGARAMAWGPNDEVVVSAQITTTTFGLVVIPPGGPNTLLATFSSYDELPTDITVSPDGSTVAYSFLDDIYAVPSDGSSAPRKLFDAGPGELREATFSPDGQYLAFTRDFFNCGRIHIASATLPGTLEITSDQDDPTVYRIDGDTVLSCGSGMCWRP